MTDDALACCVAASGQAHCEKYLIDPHSAVQRNGDPLHRERDLLYCLLKNIDYVIDWLRFQADSVVHNFRAREVTSFRDCA